MGTGARRSTALPRARDGRVRAARASGERCRAVTPTRAVHASSLAPIRGAGSGRHPHDRVGQLPALVSAQGASVSILTAPSISSRGKVAGRRHHVRFFPLCGGAVLPLRSRFHHHRHGTPRGWTSNASETFLLATTNKAEIAKQGNRQVRVPPIVRIPTYGRALNEAIVKQVLDMGAFGIMFPAIENKTAGARGGQRRPLSPEERHQYPTPGAAATATCPPPGSGD